MGQVTVRLMAPFSIAVGTPEVSMAWDGTMTLGDLLARLVCRYPRLQRLLPREGIHEEALTHQMTVVMDMDILSLDSKIPEGSTVDIFAPLSGGV